MLRHKSALTTASLVIAIASSSSPRSGSTVIWTRTRVSSVPTPPRPNTSKTPTPSTDPGSPRCSPPDRGRSSRACSPCRPPSGLRCSASLSAHYGNAGAPNRGRLRHLRRRRPPQQRIDHHTSDAPTEGNAMSSSAARIDTVAWRSPWRQKTVAEKAALYGGVTTLAVVLPPWPTIPLLLALCLATTRRPASN